MLVSHRQWVFIVCAILLVPMARAAGTGSAASSGDAARVAPAALFAPADFRARRARVCQAIGEDLALLVGIDEPQDYRRPRQHNNFYYLTGVETPGAALAIDGRTREATLFLPARHLRRAAEEIARETGIDHVVENSRFTELVRRAAEGRGRLFLPRWPGEGNAQARDSFPSPSAARPEPPADRRPSRAEDFRDGVLSLTGPIEVVDLETVLDPMRRVKDAAEIAAMRGAGRIGAEAIADAVRATRPGILERELEGVCELAFLRNGAHAGAWTTIVASGPNLMNFHYFANTRRIEPADMILVDAGPDFAYYCSDITRAWPASGPYPDRYRELYDKLLAVHRAAVDAVAPGVRIADIGRAMLAEADAQGIRPYVLTNPGHYTGMAPHDVGDRAAPFVPGVCFNVEPLLVIPAELIHLRFEDTVLCTETGHECLTPLDVLPWEAEKLLEMRDRR